MAGAGGCYVEEGTAAGLGWLGVGKWAESRRERKGRQKEGMGRAREHWEGGERAWREERVGRERERREGLTDA